MRVIFTYFKDILKQTEQNIYCKCFSVCFTILSTFLKHISIIMHLPSNLTKMLILRVALMTCGESLAHTVEVKSCLDYLLQITHL